ncbi:hypothetical protein [Plantibacter sp. YIM 135249]|uniref:hypothetical protein n=1 Tax=Plantibacter sp. YIM 135249 TaxID=3423918 RepID=UPI003D34170A
MTIDVGSQLKFVRDTTRIIGDDSTLRRAAVQGSVIRVRPGVYIDTATWEALDRDARYLARIHAVARTRRANTPLVSHLSSAALHRLPIAGAWPAEVHLTCKRSMTGRRVSGVTRHATGYEGTYPEVIDGVTVTGLARTLVDVAATEPFVRSVPMLDHALRLGWVTVEELLMSVEQRSPFRGARRVRLAIEFADAAAESVAESVSRVNFSRIGAPRPVLQRAWRHPDGRTFRTDFHFEAYDTIGEVDGRGKYKRAEMLHGRTPEDVLWEEKQREDWLRMRARAFLRWDWSVAMSPEDLRRRLAGVGIPTGLSSPLRGLA